MFFITRRWKQNRKGIILLPIIFIIACIGTAAEFGYMFYCMATGR